jgi:hypothetical protein
MNKSWFYPIAIGSLTILTTSCGDSGKPTAPTPTASPPAATSPATTPTATIPATAPAPTVVPTVAASAPTVPGKPASVSVAAGLIAPTDGDNWAKTVSKGRSDPFATLALQPIEVAEKYPLDGTGRPQRTSSTIATNNSPAIKSGVNQPLPRINNAPIANNGLKQKPGSKSAIGYGPISAIPKSGVNKALPKITVGNQVIKPSKSPTGTEIANNNVLRPVNVGAPNSKASGPTKIATRIPKAVEKPLQAMALEISGVIEISGKTQVIVKLPNESFSRYIEVGTRVANGKVLVKRVEGQQSLSPTIVLEEVGVEVARKIGDKPVASTPEAAPKPVASTPEAAPKPVASTPEATPKP